MEILRIILTVIFVLDCIGLTVIVLMQEGKQQGLGSIAGVADTYWGRNKGDVYKRQVYTVDGVKKRVRPGMGRCQGGFCMPLVAEIISEVTGQPLEKVKKSGGDSYLLFGKTKAGDGK